jgi:FKBP-type peptidyl-prolyl cis-trans isomerase SlyD
MIQKGKVIGIAYTLKSASGEVLDQGLASDPLVYLHGHGNLIPGLESVLEGKAVGFKSNVQIAPEEAYGQVHESLKQIVDRSAFPADAELEVGMGFHAHSDDGSPMSIQIEKIEGEKIHINGNHPLAGQTLFFDVEVLSERDATAEEVSHGHAHGPGGHHHH